MRTLPAHAMPVQVWMERHTSNSPTPLQVFGAASGAFSLLSLEGLGEGSGEAREPHSGVSAGAGTCRTQQLRGQAEQGSQLSVTRGKPLN